MKTKLRTLNKLAVFFFIILMLSLILSGCTFGKKAVKPVQISKGNFELASQELDKYITAKMKSEKVIGFSIAVVSDDKIVFSKGYGYADKENKIPVTPETIFRMGSISKLFTATSIMQLNEQGKLDIDKPLNTYLKDFSIKTRYKNSDIITLRNIMTHHSGLPSDRFKDMKTNNPISYKDLIIELQDQYTAFPPNFIFSYSNLAITLLGRVVEVVSGNDFISYVDKNILSPMDMKNSSFELKEHMKKINSKGYIKKQPVKQYKTYAVPAGLLYSNAEDMSKFIITILNQGEYNGKKVIKPETLKEMFTQQNETIELDYGYKMGLGWFFDDSFDYAGRIYMHDGAWDDYRANLNILPKYKLGVITMTNSPKGTMLIYSAAQKALKLFLIAKAGLEKPDEPKVKPPAAESISYSIADIKKFAGLYIMHPSYGGLKIIEKKGKLFLSVDKIKIELVPQDDGWFSMTLVLLKIFKQKLPQSGQLYFKEINGKMALLQRRPGMEVIVGF